jgi:hypothetical protein
MLVSYVQPSMDAAIAGNYKDLRFKNNTDAPVYIEGYTSGGILYFNVYGKETRASNREISFESETLSTTDPATQYNLDSSSSLGSWSVVQSAHQGCVAQLWKIVTVDGVQQSRDLFNKSTYQSSPKIVTIGTKDASETTLAALKTAISSGDESAVRSAAAALKSKADEKAEEEEQQTEEDDKSTDKDKKDKNKNKEDKNKEDASSDKNTDNTSSDSESKPSDTGSEDNNNEEEE